MTQQPGTPRNPVREVRQALGLSQQQMAVELGCNQSVLWNWEQAGTLPRKAAYLAELRLLAKQAGIDIEL